VRQDTYNDRLFHGNRARRFLHERRFWWLVDRLQRLKIRRADIIEIGCYDGKTVSYLERSGIAVTAMSVMRPTMKSPSPRKRSGALVRKSRS
jgi:hypothetical protein